MQVRSPKRATLRSRATVTGSSDISAAHSTSLG